MPVLPGLRHGLTASRVGGDLKVTLLVTLNGYIVLSCNSPLFHRGAGAAIVVYDITSSDSFIRAQSWIRELHQQAKSDIIIALAGNKSDLESLRSVKYEEASSYAEENNLIFFETSAKNAHNVYEIFADIAKKIPEKWEHISAPNGTQLLGNGTNNGGKKPGDCCKI